MKYISVAITVFFTAFTLSCRARKHVEVEDNGSFSSANIIQVDRPVSGHIGSSTDRDIYALEIDHESIISANLTGIKGVNHAIKIWKDNGTPMLLKWIDDRRKSSPESVINVFAGPGRYYIEICHGERDTRKGNIDTPYTLTVSALDADPVTEETEPNDTPENADIISTEGDITGYFSPSFNRLNNDSTHPAREEDWYVLTVDTGDKQAVLIDLELTGVPGINSLLQLYDREQGLIISSNTSGPGAGEQMRGVGITQSGNYYILVASEGYSSNETDTYTLSVRTRDKDPLMEMEPNNSFSTATSMSGPFISGSLSSGDDKDIFYSRLPDEQHLYRLELLHKGTFDSRIFVHDSNMEKAAEIDNCAICDREIHPDLALEGGVYITVSARHPVPDNSGYELRLTPLDDSQFMEIEPNNTRNTATPVTSSTVFGYVSARADKDYYLLDYETRVRLKITITGAQGAELRLSITDPLGYIIKSVTVKDNADAVLTEMIDRKGYIIIESRRDNYENPYSFTLEVK